MDEGLRGAIAGIHEPWGGALCLDFANTVEPRGGPPPFTPPPGSVVRDELLSYLGLVAWAVRLDLVPLAIGDALVETAEANPGEAERVLTRGRTLRDAIYRIFAAVARGEGASVADLATLHHEYVEATAHAALRERDSGYAWDWPDDVAQLARPLWPAAWSAADLLVNGDRARVRVCPGYPGQPMPCAWLFYDRTKNKSRRWCSMTDCGSATKTQRQTRRRRHARGPAPGNERGKLA